MNTSIHQKRLNGRFPPVQPDYLSERAYLITREHVVYGRSYRELAYRYGMSHERVRQTVRDSTLGILHHEYGEGEPDSARQARERERNRRRKERGDRQG